MLGSAGHLHYGGGGVGSVHTNARPLSSFHNRPSFDKPLRRVLLSTITSVALCTYFVKTVYVHRISNINIKYNPVFKNYVFFKY